MGPRLLLLLAALVSGLTAAACAAGGAGAAAATDDVDSLWCLYGLAGCSKPASPLQQKLPQVPEAWESQIQPSNAPAVDSVPTKLGQWQQAPAALVANQAASDATLPSAASQQEGMATQAAAVEAGQPRAGGEQALPRAIASQEPHAGTAPEATAVHLPERTSLAGITGQEPSGVTEEDGTGTNAARVVEREGDKAAAGGIARRGDKVHAAAQHITQAPLLLGSCMALAALVSMLRRTRRRRLPATPSRQAACQQTAASVPKQTAVGNSKDTDSVAAGKLVAPALPAVVCPSGESAAAADLSSLSSPASPVSPNPRTGPPPLDVDPSVKARDATKQGWVAVEPAAVGSSAGSGRRKSEFHNPLYHTEGSTAAEHITAEQLGGPPTDNLSGSAAEWQAKAAAAVGGAADVQEGEGADFRLLAAALPKPEFAASWAGGEANSLPTEAATQTRPASSAFAASRRSTSSDLPSPGSPSKVGRKAPRKLTAARSVGPQELPLPPGSEDAIAEGDEEAEEEAPALPALGALQSCGLAVSVHPAEASEAAPTHAHRSGVAPQRQAAEAGAATAGSSANLVGASSSKQAPDLCLLTAREFQEQVKLGRLLGAGAAACVYAGEWRGQQVAVKVAHPSSADPKSFAREVGVMAAVGRHPHIIGVLAACLEQPLAVVQELAHGSLHDQLHTLRLRPQYGLLMQLAEDIASALEHCHAQRPPVVHRDLSGRNVLLGRDGRARLADFGLASAKRRTFLSSDKAGALGTAAYMAPEAMQAGQISERCDVFAFGVLLWELLTGRQAWEEYDSPLAIIFAVGVERRRLPIPPGCPPPLAKLLKECWRHNAPLRPSFTEVLARLRQMRRTDQFFQLTGPLVPGPAAGGKAAALASSGSVASSSSRTGKGRRVLPVTAVAAGSRAGQPPLPTVAT